MLPLPSLRSAPVTVILAVALAAAFLYQDARLPHAVAPGLGGEALAGALLSYPFHHVDLLHLAGNLAYLLFAGAAVERAAGAGRLLGVFGVAGAVGALAYLGAGGAAPLVGASGAVAGLLGAQLVLAGREEVLALNPLLLPAPVLRVPAWLVVGCWGVQQAVLLLIPGLAPGVAVSAHVGGFIAGLLLGGFAAARDS